MIVAIHQPNFFPWLGYFNKMIMCDTFVVLDHVEAMWRSTWLTRNRVLTGTDAANARIVAASRANADRIVHLD